ncbi:cytochrome p450 [Hirsutella rhossiliensis]|uniref:Cytochrome p450 domain-containing protein n=1 Tax=Hirsutella rhossiliensis TaxID=111463 RepID=A0A9P8SHD0_9HYPO|nr:cytochrome p450 domain-containing protein [Hirsutella rhossiliensis]KAH0960891.1 cytochrome p450 domain-containing protein [Hirsutella rhossiliensis]
MGLVVGVLAHVCLFIRGEWHLQTPQIALSHSALYLACPALAAVCRGSVLCGLLDMVARGSWGYLPGLVGSIVLYRVFFHPLTAAGFPGPWYARVSKLWHVWAARHSKNHLVLAHLHAKYGDFVRTGPAEVTVFHPDVFVALESPRSECIKADWYDLIHPSLGLVTVRDKSVHAARRREWNRGFTAKAVAEHEAKMLKHVDQLDRCIEADARARRVSDVRDLLLWFGLDAMSDFTFSRSFRMLQARDWHYMVPKLLSAFSLVGPLSPAPWLFQLSFKLGPRVGVLGDWFDAVAWSSAQMHHRIQSGSSGQTPDLVHYLMEGDADAKDEDRRLWLEGDSLVAILAGSEPTAVALTAVFCELAKHPEHAHKIYLELAHVHVTDLAALAGLAHLNAVIKEAHRLYPALLTAGNRKTTARGIDIAGTFIPPNTTIVAPRFSIARRDDCFEKPHDFVPERWTTRPEMILNMAAYNPFGIGHRSCVGRSMAMDTMRYVVARLVKKYEFHAGPGDDNLRVMEDIKDRFTPRPGALRLCFVPRDEA